MLQEKSSTLFTLKCIIILNTDTTFHCYQVPCVLWGFHLLVAEYNWHTFLRLGGVPHALYKKPDRFVPWKCSYVEKVGQESRVA